MKNPFLIPLAFALVILSIPPVSHSQEPACATGQYFSDYTKKCEKAVLQLGTGERLHSLDLEVLESLFESTTFHIDKNPAYEKNGTVEQRRLYRGIRIKDILRTLMPEGESLNDYVLAATCLDGFDPVMESDILARLNGAEAYLAYEQKDIPSAAALSKDSKWELVRTQWGIVSPGPFYIVWTEPQGTYWKGWPFQIKSLRLMKATDYQAMIKAIRPSKAVMALEPKSSIETGFDQFRGKCLTCHSLNGVGGKKARADLLAVVRSLNTSARSLELIRSVIKNPPAGMSDIKDIKFSDDDLRHINDYLRHLSGA